MSVGLGRVAVDVEVAGGGGEGDGEAVQVPVEDDLAAEAGAGLEEGRLVQHVLLLLHRLR